MNAKFEIGNKVRLTPPSIEDRDEFLEQVEKSREIHFPWVSPPTNAKKFNEYIDKLHRENQYGFFLKLKTTHKIIGVININDAWRDHERFALTKEDFLMNHPGAEK